MQKLLLTATTCLLLLEVGVGFFTSVKSYQQQNARSICSMSLFGRIRSAIIRQQPDGEINRVINCWDRFATGVGVERFLDPPNNLVLQTADCFVEGLCAKPFHEIESFPWALQLEEHSAEILEELNKNIAKQNAIRRRLMSSESEWLSPRDTAGSAYGPEWKTLGLQDRSVWDEEKVSDYPVTVRLLKEFNVPSCEVFFAKQGTKFRSCLLPNSYGYIILASLKTPNIFYCTHHVDLRNGLTSHA